MWSDQQKRAAAGIRVNFPSSVERSRSNSTLLNGWLKLGMINGQNEN